MNCSCLAFCSLIWSNFVKNPAKNLAIFSMELKYWFRVHCLSHSHFIRLAAMTKLQECQTQRLCVQMKANTIGMDANANFWPVKRLTKRTFCVFCKVFGLKEELRHVSMIVTVGGADFKRILNRYTDIAGSKLKWKTSTIKFVVWKIKTFCGSMKMISSIKCKTMQGRPSSNNWPNIETQDIPKFDCILVTAIEIIMHKSIYWTLNESKERRDINRIKSIKQSHCRWCTCGKSRKVSK